MFGGLVEAPLANWCSGTLRSTTGWKEDHLAAVGGVTVLVEVEAGAIGFFRQAHHPMASLGVDPGLGRFRPLRQKCRQREDSGQAAACNHGAPSYCA
jgi:hypothetical protein